MAAAQLLNWQAFGLDGWWLLLLGGGLAWLPPELPGIATAWLGTAAAAAAGCCRGGLRASVWLSPANQPWQPADSLQPWQRQQRQEQGQQEEQQGRVGGGSIEMLSGGAWSSWFWEGSAAGGRQRHRQQPVPVRQRDPERRADAAVPGSLALQGGSCRSWLQLPLRTRLCLVLLGGLCVYHVITPLSFLAYPSR